MPVRLLHSEREMFTHRNCIVLPSKEMLMRNSARPAIYGRTLGADIHQVFKLLEIIGKV
jgi:hypothetical protein